MNDILVPTALVAQPDRFGGTAQGDCLRGQPVVQNTRLIALAPPNGSATKVVIPTLVEAHCHLDKCHTVHRMGQVGGDLAYALKCQFEDKANWTASDLRTRAQKGLAEAQANGCRLVRSHVDWGDNITAPLSWSILCELAQDTQGLHCAALTSIQHLCDALFADTVGKTLAQTNGVFGAFVHGQDNMRVGLQAMFDAAARYGLMLDFHVDEGLGALNGLEAIADMALATRFDAPILCGHAVSLMDRNVTDFARIADKLARADITICALPITNMYLQGRTDGTPDRRGITRLRELRKAGVRVLVGSDNVADAFCPIGAHDPRAALALACVTAHLDPPFGDWLGTITTDARIALGHAPVHVDGALLCDLLTCDAAHTADLVSGRTPLRDATDTLQ